ncbi:hypothetical protein L6164_032838 [Bauhinia variegata]|uniref:Uncharacterized protein n=1 Tax=Bauhinia variegata TaxID=167791 RepID=A0ACB9KQ10_BAUVA|nr:hypothetical protein L6164_032838 [Bauhinia variegata]
MGLENSKSPDEILEIFRSQWPNSTVYNLPNGNFMALPHEESPTHPGLLRDRAPCPPDQVVKHLEGKFAFIIYDANTSTLFAARDREGSVEFQWGMASDGSLVCSDDTNITRDGCGKFCAPFPPGCIFINGSGLTSFDHPLHKVRAIAHKDDHENISTVFVQVDLYTRIPSIPCSGSASNWADAVVVEGD